MLKMGLLLKDVEKCCIVFFSTNLERNKEDPDSCRPLRLLNSMAKVFEQFKQQKASSALDGKEDNMPTSVWHQIALSVYREQRIVET